jgi:glycosyltransferase involved in cell wall biosynthesis
MKLTIGMPVYNGAPFLVEALDSLLAQTYSDWKLIISDNCSQDDTEAICRSYALKDARIEYIRQETNIGAVNNFEYVLYKATTPFFMWAACDDVWNATFIESLIGVLEKKPEIGLAFSHSQTIDTYGGVVQTFQNFLPFSGAFGVLKYIVQPQILGKSSLLYGIYRTSACREAWSIKPIYSTRGSDNTFVLALLARHKIYIDPRVLFLKRWPREGDVKGAPTMTNYTAAWRYSLPVRDSYYYAREALAATRGTAYYFFVWFMILISWPLVVFNDRARQFEKVKRLCFRLAGRV